MRQQLRLNVLIPVAVLGLLGAGFGAYAMGSAPGPDPVAAPVTTTAPAAPAAPAKPPKPGPVTAEAWATGANELCGKALQDLQVVADKPATAKELQQSFARLKELYAWYNPALKALGWPQGERALVAQLWTTNARTSVLVTKVHRAFKARDYDRVLSLVEGAEKKLGEPEKIYRRLGAKVCADQTGKALRNARGTETLEWMLLRHRTVVAVFYAPNSSVDARAVVEARAAALDTGAGFVAVNVKHEAQVAALAIGYEVLNTPSVLVFTRGPKLESHFTGVVDRVTVAQAVTNARR